MTGKTAFLAVVWLFVLWKVCAAGVRSSQQAGGATAPRGTTTRRCFFSTAKQKTFVFVLSDGDPVSHGSINQYLQKQSGHAWCQTCPNSKPLQSCAAYQGWVERSFVYFYTFKQSCLVPLLKLLAQINSLLPNWELKSCNEACLVLKEAEYN